MALEHHSFWEVRCGARRPGTAGDGHFLKSRLAQKGAGKIARIPRPATIEAYQPVPLGSWRRAERFRRALQRALLLSRVETSPMNLVLESGLDSARKGLRLFCVRDVKVSGNHRTAFAWSTGTTEFKNGRHDKSDSDPPALPPYQAHPTYPPYSVQIRTCAPRRSF